jgi:hypothetical protein
VEEFADTGGFCFSFISILVYILLVMVGTCMLVYPQAAC